MSHVETVEVSVLSLESLAAAAKRCGLEYVENQKTYKWFGQSVGDYPLPEGFTADDLGKCEHALRIPGDEHAYEIGVVRRRDGQPGYTLAWDFWNGGYGLRGLVGDGCSKLKQAYATEVAAKQLRKQGFRVSETEVNGKIKLVARR